MWSTLLELNSGSSLRNGPELQHSVVSAHACLFYVTSGEHCYPGLIQSVYLIEERKGFAPNHVGSGKNLGEGSCLLTLVDYDDSFFFFTSTPFSYPSIFYSFKIFIVYVLRVNAGSIKKEYGKAPCS